MNMSMVYLHEMFTEVSSAYHFNDGECIEIGRGVHLTDHVHVSCQLHKVLLVHSVLAEQLEDPTLGIHYPSGTQQIQNIAFTNKYEGTLRICSGIT